MTTPTDIQRLARLLADHPTDKDARTALCVALIRSGHGPDATRLALLTLGLQMRTLVNGVLSDDRDWTDDTRRLLVLSLRASGKAMGLGACVEQLIGEHLGWVDLMLKDHQEAEAAGETVSTHQHLGPAMLRNAGDSEPRYSRYQQSSIAIDDVRVGSRLRLDVTQGAEVFFVRSHGAAQAKWRLSVEPPDRDVYASIDGVPWDAWHTPDPYSFFTCSTFSIRTPPGVDTTLILERIE